MASAIPATPWIWVPLLIGSIATTICAFHNHIVGTLAPTFWFMLIIAYPALSTNCWDMVGR